MANRKTRKIAVRRDRRKAKASRWHREGKRAMSGGRIGHGQGGTHGTVRVARPRRRKAPKEKKAKPLTATIAELTETE
jgi:hypothetical protein